MERDREADDQGRGVGVGQEIRAEVLEVGRVAQGLDDVERGGDEEKIGEEEEREARLAGLDLDDGRQDFVQATFRHDVARAPPGRGYSLRKLRRARSSSSKMSRTLVSMVTWKIRKSFFEMRASLSFPPRLWVEM